MPQALSEAEIDALIAAAVAAAGAGGMAAMGKVMAVLKPQLAGRADMAPSRPRSRQAWRR